MIDLGTVQPGSTIRIPFSTFNTAGAAVTMTNFAAADILIYKDGSTTERASTSGYTATTDFDGKTGKHLAIIDLADNTTADFFAAGSEYIVAIDSVTVDSQTVGAFIGRFRIGYSDAVHNTTIATLSSQTSFTLTAGPADDNALVGCIALIHDAASAIQRAIGVVSAYTGSTKTVTLAADPGIFTMAAKDNISFFIPSNTRFLAGASAGPTNLNTIFNTDYATVYDTTNKALLSKLGNFAMGGTSLNLSLGTFSTSGTSTLNALTVTNATTLSGAVSLGSTLSVTGTTSFAAMTITGTGSSSGLVITGGPTCVNTQGALRLVGGSTSGAGMSLETTDGHGLVITGTGSARHGIYITSGSSGVSNAIYAAVPGGSGFGIRATTVDVISNVSVGGTTTLTGAVTASNASNNITGITASTVSDKTGYRLSATGVDDIWDEVQSGHATAGTFGLYLDTAISGISGGASAASIADAVWDEARSGHVAAGSFGEYVLAKTHGDANIAVASTALSTAQWTNARAGYLDNINNSNLASVPAFPSNFASLSITAAGLVSTTSNVKKNQALSSFMFLMTDSTNHAPATGLTVTVTRSIDGGAFAAGTLSSVTEVSAGMYKVDFAAADLNGNVIVLKATATAADTTLERIVTQP